MTKHSIFSRFPTPEDQDSVDTCKCGAGLNPTWRRISRICWKNKPPWHRAIITKASIHYPEDKSDARAELSRPSVSLITFKIELVPFELVYAINICPDEAGNGGGGITNHGSVRKRINYDSGAVLYSGMLHFLRGTCRTVPERLVGSVSPVPIPLLLA